MARARRRRPAGAIGIIGITLCIGTMMTFNLAHRLSLALFIVMPLICAAFIAGGWIEARWRIRREVRHIADACEDETPTD